MRHPLKTWLAAATLIVLLAGAALYWFQWRTLTAAPDLLTYLPPSESALVYLDVATLRRTSILQTIAGAKVTEDAEYKTFVAETGFDYKRDLDAVLGSLQDTGKFFVVSGHFNWDALSRYARQHGGSCMNDLCRMPGSQPNRQISFYPLRRNLLALAVSEDAWAASLITPHRKVAPPEFPAEPVWLSLPSAAIKKDALPAGTRAFASALQDADTISLALGRGANGFEATLRVLCHNANDAARLTGQLKGATDTLRTLISREKQTPNPNDLSGVLTSGSFRQDDRRVHGTWPMPEALLRSLTEGGI